MAAGLYVFSMKSEELRGASQPNILKMWLASDDDAAIFKTNLESLFSVDVVTVNSELIQNYALPYPAGTNAQGRCDIIDADQRHSNQTLHDLDLTKSQAQLAADLITAAIRLPYGDITLATAINVDVITPGPSKF